jgi:hypothetical protein
LAGFFVGTPPACCRSRRLSGISMNYPTGDKKEYIFMETIEVCDAGDAVSSMQALRSAMTVDLDDIEQRIESLSSSPWTDSESAIEEMKVYCVARAALYSGLASINEVLGWVHLMAEKDAEGNVSEAVKMLPTVAVFSIH